VSFFQGEISMAKMFHVAMSAALVALAGIALPAVSADKPAPAKKPKVEVVFCLDTTGSMGGLIDGAKAKIWAICNQIAGGKPTPDLKVGLVAYRDKGDDYVTKVVDLTDDLDKIHGQLKTFQAAGGGDTPEHVNQALYDAVHKVKWSADKKTLKIIFLVGDAPPHMDYKDDVKYPETCKKAVEKDILINTIQCGTDADCTKFWKDIAAKSEGSFAAIPQNGGVVAAIATPFDARLAKINSELADTTLAYGTATMRRLAEKSKKEVKDLPAPAAADRAGFAGKSGGGSAAPKASPAGAAPSARGGDLVEALREKKVDLAKLKDDELPDEVRKLKTPKEREEYVKKVEGNRTKLQKEALELDKKRGAHIAEEMKKKGKGKDKDSFDSNVLEMLRKQAKKYDIGY
jgi:Mg-chelatase subunit ChlD